MADPEIVVRLLAAIDKVERPELDARGDHELRWTMGETADTWRVECHHCDWSAEGPERVINPAGDQHARECVSMPTSPVLRLCQSHRDIVNRYTGALFTQSCHPEYEANNGYVEAMAAVVGALARGYGVEET